MPACYRPGADFAEPSGHAMTERHDLRDEHGRITGYVLREPPHRAVHFRPGRLAPRSESPLVVVLCLVIGTVMLVATLAYLWAAATAG